MYIQSIYAKVRFSPGLNLAKSFAQSRGAAEPLNVQGNAIKIYTGPTGNGSIRLIRLSQIRVPKQSQTSSLFATFEFV